MSKGLVGVSRPWPLRLPQYVPIVLRPHRDEVSVKARYTFFIRYLRIENSV